MLQYSMSWSDRSCSPFLVACGAALFPALGRCSHALGSAGLDATPLGLPRTNQTPSFWHMVPDRRSSPTWTLRFPPAPGLWWWAPMAAAKQLCFCAQACCGLIYIYIHTIYTSLLICIDMHAWAMHMYIILNRSTCIDLNSW